MQCCARKNAFCFIKKKFDYIVMLHIKKNGKWTHSWDFLRSNSNFIGASKIKVLGLKQTQESLWTPFVLIHFGSFNE